MGCYDDDDFLPHDFQHRSSGRAGHFQDRSTPSAVVMAEVPHFFAGSRFIARDISDLIPIGGRKKQVWREFF